MLCLPLTVAAESSMSLRSCVAAPSDACLAEWLRGKPHTPHPRSYDVIGPFPIGKNEVDGDPMAAVGGAFEHWLHTASRRRGRVASELAPGGHVSWAAVRPTADGTLPLDWRSHGWQALVQSLGQRAVLEAQAWAMGGLAVKEDGHYTLDCQGVHKATLHASVGGPPVVVAGDLYRSAPHGGGGFGVALRAGVYVLSLRARVVMQGAVKCRLAPARAPWFIAPPPLVPDVVLADDAEPALCGGLVALPVRSTGAAGWLRGLEVSSADAGVEAAVASRISVDVAPGQLMMLPVRLRLRPPAKLRCPFGARLDVRARSEAGEALSATVRVGGGQCRKPSQSVVCTFADHDGAVSAAAVIRPLNGSLCDAAAGCPVLLSLHGTSIPVRDSADAYKHKPAGVAGGDFTFGVDRMWVVAPTRHGAHNWEQGGRLTSLAAVEALASAPPATLPSAVPMDRERVVFVGHSMGGHGAWLGAVQGASRALGVASVSGWLRKET